MFVSELPLQKTQQDAVSPAPLIELINLYYNYPEAPQILQGVNITLYEGERLCLTGANGAGKSTLLRLIVGLAKPVAGEVHIFGEPMHSEKAFRKVRCEVGLVFQDADDQLFCPTVAEDVAFGPLNQGKSRAEAQLLVNQTLTQLGISHFSSRLTHKLSGGEKRLVALATVLAMQPKVLLLDEPTTALDESTTQRLIDILLGLPQAMLIVSHNPHFREAVETRALRLEEGTIK